ncbi:hypothetical protein PSHT_13565 [Puccinia striiformis]|uniref:Uncharacterized protein n=1 Tax=Puccinia striiformis TaxID=27350 RepID=A0A2S4UQ56_9BASI|nr:hypothetical protein PSHT_13565 [Puccinia striiformis]
MPYRLTQNPSPLIPSVPQLDGNSVTFPAWQSRLEDVLAIQGVLDIVQGKVPRPKEQPTDSKPIVRTEKGYNPEEFRVDWDTLSDIARSTIKLTLSVNLSIRYKDLKPASKLFNTICKAYEKNTRACRLFLRQAHPNNQQICDRLLRGLDDSWKPIRDHLVLSGALESHEVSTQVSTDHFDATASAAKTKPKLGLLELCQKGHHSSKCSNPSIKNKPPPKRIDRARAGSVSFATLAMEILS